MRPLNLPPFRWVALEHVFLVLLVVVALALRLNGLNWDSGYGFHPDERSLYMRAGCMYDLLTESPGYENCLVEHPFIEPRIPGIRTFLDFDRSPLNPHWFPLGSALIYVLVLFRFVIEAFTDIGALDMRYVGRTLSALADVGTVVLVYVLGRRMYGARYGPWVAALAATLATFAVIHVQHSHFYRPETFTAFMVLAVFWAMLRLLEKRRLRDSLLLGLLVGLAFAPKVSILPLALPLALTYYLRLVDSGNGKLTGLPRAALEQTFLHCLAALAMALAVFFLASPYALLYISNFVGEQAAQAEMARTAGLWPFTIQYVGTPSFLYQFKQTAVWGLGPPLGIVAWASIPFTVFLLWRGGSAGRGDLLILAWLIPSIIFLESFEVRFQRYYFALIPFMILLGSRMLLWAPFTLRARDGRGSGVEESRAGRRGSPGTERLRQIWMFVRHHPAGRLCVLWAAWGLVFLVLATTVLYSLAFQRIYSSPHPAVAASRWLNQTVPPGAAIVSDNHWDEFIPELYDYRVWQFPAYEPDNVGKMAELGKRLSDSDYLVFYSHRPYVSVASDPERFPLSGEYYRRLFSGDLGYVLEREFVSNPGLPGIEIRDNPFARTSFARPTPETASGSSGAFLDWGYADDNVVGYDHPTVLIFRNRDGLAPEAIIGLLLHEAGEAPTGLKYSDGARAIQQAGGTWSELFDRGGFANQVPVLAWLLVVELLYLAALPFCLFLFRPLADRGMALARLLGLLGAAYMTWLVVSLGWMDFSGSSIWLGIVVMGAVSGLALATHFEQAVDFLKQKWRLFLTVEVIFLTAFLAFVAIRAMNPDLWHPYRGGEKPMELAYFNAVMRSTLMPPYDPWFAGGYLNYYYWGYFILAIPARLSGVIPTVAFNLAVPLLFALTVSGAFSVVYNLAAGVRKSRGAANVSQRGSAVQQPEMGRGEPSESASKKGSTRLGDAFSSPTAAGLMGALFVAVIGNLDGAIQLVQRSWDKLGGSAVSLLPLDFWRSSRMLPNLENVEAGFLTFWLWGKTDGPADVSWHITEFPFFSFLFADLHAHMMAIPITILSIALGMNLLLGIRRQGPVWHVAALVTAGIAVGSLWAINSWDYPSLLLLSLALVSLAAFLAWKRNKDRLAAALALSIGLAVVSILAFLPFHQAVETFDTGLEVSKWKTPLINFLGIHGLFLVVIGAFFLWQARHPLSVMAGGNLKLGFLELTMETDGRLRGHRGWLRCFVVAGLVLFAFFALAGYWTAAALVVFLILAGLVAWDSLVSTDPGKAYNLVALVLTMLGFGLAAGVDLVRVEGDIGRMNTLFKYYLEVWVLLALAAAFFLWLMWYDNWLGTVRFRWLNGVWLSAVALLVGCGLVYTVLGTHSRVGDRFHVLSPTLKGDAYMEQAVHWEREQAIELKWDAEAIRWLQDNVQGSPAILEAHTEQYRWGGRMANYTGLPTVLGWPWHQIQQRGSYSGEVYDRAEDIRTMYESDDLEQRIGLLAEYEVKYVVAGDLERIIYSPEKVGKFDIMAQNDTIKKVFDNGRTAIYAVHWTLGLKRQGIEKGG